MGSFLSTCLGGSEPHAPFDMTFAVAPEGGFASSYEKDSRDNFGFLVPGDEELFLGGGALNGAVGKCLYDANHPIQFDKGSGLGVPVPGGKYVMVKEENKDVPKFSKHTCPYRKVQLKLFEDAKKNRGRMVIADAADFGELPVKFSAGRVYSNCKDPFGATFIHIIKDKEYCPFGNEKNCAVLYTVGALGKNAKAPGEGVVDPARAAKVKTNVQEFLEELYLTGENVVDLVYAYNKHADKKNQANPGTVQLPPISVIRLPIVSGGIFLHPETDPKGAALALIWGVHNGLARNADMGGQVRVELMPGKPMQDAYADYKAKKKSSDPEYKGVFAKITPAIA